MEDIIKELYDYLEGRIDPDREIILDEVEKFDCEARNDENDSFKRLCAQHRLIDLMDLCSAYTNFRDKVAKVKNNIEFDSRNN